VETLQEASHYRHTEELHRRNQCHGCGRVALGLRACSRCRRAFYCRSGRALRVRALQARPGQGACTALRLRMVAQTGHAEHHNRLAEQLSFAAVEVVYLLALEGSHQLSSCLSPALLCVQH